MGVLHGKRMYVFGTVGQIKKIVGKHAKQVQISDRAGVVEIIHSDNRGKIFELLREAKIIRLVHLQPQGFVVE